MQAPLWYPPPSPCQKSFLCLPWHSREGLKEQWLNLVTNKIRRKVLYQQWQTETIARGTSSSDSGTYIHSTGNASWLTHQHVVLNSQSLTYSTGARLTSEQRCLGTMSALRITLTRNSMGLSHYIEIFFQHLHRQRPPKKVLPEPTWLSQNNSWAVTPQAGKHLNKHFKYL